MSRAIAESDLHDALWQFHDAIQRREGVEERLRRGESSAALHVRGLAAAEAVVQARLRLYRVLIEQGWRPPKQLTGQVAADLALLGEEDDHSL